MSDWLPFLGEDELTIDEKNRLLIPSDIRRKLDPVRDGEGFIVMIGRNLRPWLYPQKYYEKMLGTQQLDIAPDQTSHENDLMYCARVKPIAWDKQGRLVLPEKMLRRTNLGRAVTLLGVRDHLELANTADWEIEDAQLAARTVELYRIGKQLQEVNRATATQQPPTQRVPDSEKQV